MRTFFSVLDPGGPAASEITALTWFLVAAGGLVSLLFLTLLTLALFRRGRHPQDDAVVEARWLKGLGMIMPAVVIGIVFATTLWVMRPNDSAPSTLQIDVIGHQWWWEVRYPTFTTANEIVIPVGEPVTFEVTSRDVIHSFWIPALGGKIDMLPDSTNEIVLEADEEGVYSGACAEFCGLQHARMRIRMTAMSKADYDAWIALQQQTATAREPAGLDVFLAAECERCHSIRGLVDGGEGPDLTHLASRATLAAGTLENTTAHLRRWISSPQDVKEGVSMPASDLSDEDLDALVAFLEGLE